jgi:hypothetical protein
MQLYDDVDRAFQAFNDFAFRSGREVQANVRHAASDTGRLFRNAVLNYGQRNDFMFLELDFSGVELQFITAAGRYGPDAEQPLQMIHKALHTYCNYVDLHKLEAIAMDNTQLETHIGQVTRTHLYDI